MLRSAALRVLPALLPALLALASLESAAALEPASSAARPSAQARVDHAKFRLEFDMAVKLGSKSKMDKLMEDMQSEAIFALIETAEAISNAPNDVLYDRFNALRDTWYRLKDNDFPDQLELYFVNLTVAEKKLRRKVKSKYDQLRKPRDEAVKAKDIPALLAVSRQYEEVAIQFKTMGDKWFESDALVAAADVADEFYHKKKTDYQRVTKLYERAIQLRNELGVKDLTYRLVQPRMKVLVGLGFGSGTPEAVEGGSDPESTDDVKKDGEKKEPLPPAGEPVTVEMSFKELKGLKDTKRPNYYLDEHRQIWPTVSLGAVGDVKDILRLGDAGPKVMRSGDSKIEVDVDRDGEPDMDWPTRGKLDSLIFEIGEGATKRKWGLQVEVGRQQDFYQGLNLNLAQTDQNMNLYYVPGGFVEGEFEGNSIEVYDDNLDGVYGSPASMWAHRELRKGVSQPEMDSLRINGEKKARPMSEHIEIPGAGWHKLESLNAGNQLSLTPVSFRTGTLQLKAKGVKPSFVILKGTGPTLSNTFIDISSGKKVEVPTGRWDLYFGLLSKGKKMQVMKCVILPSSASPSYDVKEGENKVVSIGAPFTFDFNVAKEGDEVKVVGMSVQVVGQGGEAYDRFYGSVPRPEASVRKTGSKRGYANEKMRPGESQDDIQKYGWSQCWKPLDAVLPLKGDEVEVQLIEKKNKLFGTIESDWL